MDNDPYKLDFDMAISLKARAYFFQLKHLRKARDHRKYLRKHKGN